MVCGVQGTQCPSCTRSPPALAAQESQILCMGMSRTALTPPICRSQQLLEIAASTPTGSFSVQSRLPGQAQSQQHLLCQAAQRLPLGTALASAAAGAAHGACRALRWLAGHRQPLPAKQGGMLGAVGSHQGSHQGMELSGAPVVSQDAEEP